MCPFCNLKGFMESQLVYAVLDKYPVNKGHCLVLPKRHAETWFDMTPEEQADAITLTNKVKLWLEDRYSPDGFNIGINCGVSAGQTVPHAHVHIIPRYQGDMENPEGGVRGVIPARQKYSQRQKTD